MVRTFSIPEGTEAFPKKLPADASAQGATIFERMAIGETSVDSGPEDLFEQVTSIIERVRVNAVAEGETVCDDVYLG